MNTVHDVHVSVARDIRQDIGLLRDDVLLTLVKMFSFIQPEPNVEEESFLEEGHLLHWN